MSPKDFVTYLSGAIELGDINKLEPEKFNIVSKKLNQVDNESTPEGMFCTWLKGFMEASASQELNTNQFLKVAVKLFEVVPKTELKYEPNDETLISKFPNGKEKLRC